MTRRFFASLLIVLAAADIARADVLPVPSARLTAGIIGLVIAGVAVSAGIVVTAVIWSTRRRRANDVGDPDANQGLHPHDSAE